MKVAIHLAGGSIRGNERQVFRVIRGLQARGHEVAVSCRARGPVRTELERMRVPTTGVRPGGDFDAWNALRFAAWLRREKADAVMLTSWKRMPVAGWAARVAGVPRVVLRLGGAHRVRGVRGVMERHALRRWYDGVIVNSHMLSEGIRAAVPGLPAARVRTVLNGIEPHAAAPAPLRTELGVTDDALLGVAVGAWEPRKGFDLFIEALAAVDPRVHAVLVGGGVDRDRQGLEELAHARGVAERVHFLGPRRDVPALLAAGDLFVLPSRAEGMSVAMLEGMAAGKPVVAAEVGGVWDALAPHEGRPVAGWIVPPRDAAALGRALGEAAEAVRSRPDEVAARVAEGRWRMENWFTVERMIDGYEAVLAGRAG